MSPFQDEHAAEPRSVQALAEFDAELHARLLSEHKKLVRDVGEHLAFHVVKRGSERHQRKNGDGETGT